MYKQLVKPAFDRLWAFLAFGLLLPALLLVTIILSLWGRGKPFFRQRRIGEGGQPFWMYKFRTMDETHDPAGALLPDEERLTPMGGWLRRTSVDELPQLLNIMLGQMSFVGPRPILASYRATHAGHKRHTVKPGLTGWAQVHGRNSLDWPEKFALDTWYATHSSFWLDCRILWQTLFILIDHSPPAKPITRCYSTEPAATPVS